MNTIACLVEEVVLGADTHLHTNTAVLTDLLGRQLATDTFPTTKRGNSALIAWARGHGSIRRAGVEGTGSDGLGLTRRLQLEGIEVLKVTRPARQGARHRGKTDARDALAARSVLGDPAPCRCPRHATGSWNRSACCATPRASATKARTQTLLQLNSLLVTAPDDPREHSRAWPPSN